MAVGRPSVEGPDFAKIVDTATAKVDQLEQANWDFDAVPEVFARNQAADVVGKEAVHLHDGRTMTRMGRLVMSGVGTHFNLMGAIRSDSKFKVTNQTGEVLKQINRQIGMNGLCDIPEYRRLEKRLGESNEVEFTNYGAFYRLKDLVFWLLVHDAGCFPSTLEIMVRQFAAGNIVQNNMYSTRRPSESSKKPALMTSPGLLVQFPSKVVEWMEPSIYGGLSEETIHVEHLLTLHPTHDCHPYLPLVLESKVRLVDQDYYIRTFSGVTPKVALRGRGVPEERPSKYDK